LAQGHPHRPFPPLTDELKAELKLTPEQVAQLERLHTDTRTAMEALRTQATDGTDNRREQMHQLHQQTKAKMAEILTPEQQTQWQALRAEHRAMREGIDHKAMHAALKAYRQDNILPVMQAQRAKLEATLSAADKQQLVEIRTQMMQARQAAKAERQQQRKQHAAGEAPDAPRHKRGHHGGEWKEKHPELAAKIQALATQYDADITALLEEVAPQRKQWEADQQAIRAKYLPADAPQHRHPSHGPDDAKHAERAKIKFLLMSPDKAPGTPAATAVALGASVYPNPTSGVATLTFDLPQAATLRITLLDERGNLVKTLAIERFDAGKQQYAVDATGINTGTWYIGINANNPTVAETVKLVVVK
jgi:hypothetical protein